MKRPGGGALDPAADNTEALCFSDFTFQYRAQAKPTLCNINLRVKRGEKILILGPSGSGKSTLIHCINGLIPHGFPGFIGGSLSVMGRVSVRGAPGKRTFRGAAEAGMDIFAISKLAGTVLQDTDCQFVGLSAGEDIAFAAENDCVPPELMRRRVREAAGLVQMEEHLHKSPQNLSGGQKQRVSMAGLLMDNVEILLFDEPLANLDPAAGKDAVELIDTLHREMGKTIVIVEHRLEDVLHRPVDRIILMDQGRIAADLSPAELLASDLLRKTGIREPLYLGALRYAGIGIDPRMVPENPGGISFDGPRLKEWDRTLEAEFSAAAAPASSSTVTPLLEVRNLSFFYPGISPAALDNISFTIPRGASAGLVGRNGAGKSTLAKLICGFVPAEPGTICFEGKDIAPLSIKERAERIGYVMQNPNQMISYPQVYDEAALGLRNRGAAEQEIRDRVCNVLTVCGLYPFRNWPVNALSYGQKKRLTVASILVTGPSLIILDEPTAGQDYRHYSEIMEFLMGLNRDQGLTLLLITHDMHLMLEYTEQTVVLSGGKLIAGDPAADPASILTDDGIIEAASLKRTSLYDIALRADIADPRSFVRRFIRHEKRLRERGRWKSAGEDQP
jgi:energy-coupling factor transport system ATP-binding protein